MIGSGLTGSSLTRSGMTASACKVAIAVALLAALAGCGVRGSLETPAEAKADGTAASAESGAAGANSAATPKPHRGFILDGLLR